MELRTVVVKLSGEMLGGTDGAGLDREVLDRFAAEVGEVAAQGLRVGLVVGGGNLFRGVAGAAHGMERSRADSIGMLATVMNALALEDALVRSGTPARVLSAVKMDKVAEQFTQRGALSHLDAGRVVVFAGGTGNPYFSTDSGAALRAAELGADAVLKGTKVDGVYDKDPAKHADAVRLERLTTLEVLTRGLRVMDLTAISLCRDAGIPVAVYDAGVPGNLARVVAGKPVASWVFPE